MDTSPIKARSSPIKAGERRAAVILGRPQPVRVLAASRYNPNCWLCKTDGTGKRSVVHEYELGERLPTPNAERGAPSAEHE